MGRKIEEKGEEMAWVGEWEGGSGGESGMCEGGWSSRAGQVGARGRGFPGSLTASLSLEQTAGIKTIINVRESGEDGFADFPSNLSDDVVKIHEALNETGNWSELQVDKLLARLDTAAKPVLLYCKSGARALAVGAAFGGTRSRFNDGYWQRKTLLNEHTLDLLDDVVAMDQDCQMRTFVEEYIRKKFEMHGKRPETVELPGDVWVVGQLTEEEYKEIQAEKKIVCVLNMRPFEEAGEYGMGMLTREPEIVKELGMQYEYIPVPKNGPYTAELTAQVAEKIKSLPRPLLLHCRTGRRVLDIVRQGQEQA